MNCCKSIEDSIDARCEKCCIYYCLKGENVNKFVKGYRLLWVCPYQTSRINFFKILLDFGANPYYSWKIGGHFSIIHACVLFGCVSDLSYLAEQGFDVISIKSDSNESPKNFLGRHNYTIEKSLEEILDNAASIRRNYLYKLYENVYLVLSKIKRNTLYEWRVSRIIIKYLTHNIK